MPGRSFANFLKAASWGLLTLALASPANSQQLGVEFQAYPAGVIVTARYSLAPLGNALIHLHAGMNATDRGDWGEHALEDGAGFGGGVAGHRYLGSDTFGPWIGARLDFWLLEITWKDPGRRGSSEATVLQPTGRIGWTFPVGSGRLDPSISFGQEFNVKTKGEPVGEGMILLGGIAYSF